MSMEELKPEELKIEEFTEWMRQIGYSEVTIRNTIVNLKTAINHGVDSSSKWARANRRKALRLYLKFLQERGRDES